MFIRALFKYDVGSSDYTVPNGEGRDVEGSGIFETNTDNTGKV
jgi:hypothetical protein